eukprot:TRINITY_DN24614_c0_g1_i12.p9 TRINITY_DN24614_c0_g1~~TRINITY_DN24614_c0_g1_i12.p9  ORF type:complete len:144 (-),score=9.15 TRINITY_DN24614_c0_g1_i12:1856-2287(-)
MFAKLTTGFDINADYAIVTLDDNIGQRVGWMGYGFDCGDSVQNLNTAGYPSDLDRSTTTLYETSCDQQQINACPCRSSSSSECSKRNTFQHVCDTFSGQSGSSIWRTLSDNSFQIRGIHSAGGSSNNFAVYMGPNTWHFFNDQ